MKDFKQRANFRFRPLIISERPVPIGQSITYKIKYIMLIEYTQNLHFEHFEGIASVGTGVDKIEVSTINKNEFDYVLYSQSNFTYTVSKKLFTGKILNNTNKKIVAIVKMILGLKTWRFYRRQFVI